MSKFTAIMGMRPDSAQCALGFTWSRLMPMVALDPGRILTARLGSELWYIAGRYEHDTSALMAVNDGPTCYGIPELIADHSGWLNDRPVTVITMRETGRGRCMRQYMHTQFPVIGAAFTEVIIPASGNARTSSLIRTCMPLTLELSMGGR